MKRKFIHHIIVLAMLISCGSFARGQQRPEDDSTVLSKDSLTLTDILQVVIKNHPTVKQAEEALNAADARIKLAQAGYLPTVDITASDNYIVPAPEVTFFGNKILMAPNNNFNSALNFHQMVYNFGKTSKSVMIEKENKNLADLNITMVRQNLSMITINTFYSLSYLQDAIIIKDKQLAALNEHLEFIRKKQATGSATKYEFLTTQVRISTIESQKLDLETMQKTQRAVINMLTGMPVSADTKVKQGIATLYEYLPADSLISHAYNQRTELALAKERENLAGMQYNLTNASDMPELRFMASGGGKNGYFPDLNKVQLNGVVGLDLRIPLFDGNRKKNNVALAKSTMNTSSYETELTRRNVNTEVVECDANRMAAEMKIKQFKLQLNQAEEAFSLAQISYSSGAITNLDLLDAETTVSESRLLLMKAKIDYIISIYKLKIALGDKLYVQ